MLKREPLFAYKETQFLQATGQASENFALNRPPRSKWYKRIMSQKLGIKLSLLTKASPTFSTLACNVSVLHWCVSIYI